MPKVSELYTLYLKPKHLPAEGTREATIQTATAEILHPLPGHEKKALVLSFVGRPHKLILNQGNANRMVSIGGDDFSGWAGLVIGLKRGKWGSRETIIIEPTGNGNENQKGV